MQQDITDHCTFDAQTHESTQIVTMGQRIRRTLFRAQQRKRTVFRLDRVLSGQIVGQKQRHHALGIRVAAPKYRLRGDSGLAGSLDAQRAFAQIEKARVSQVRPLLADLILIKKLLKQHFILCCLRECAHSLFAGFHTFLLIPAVCTNRTFYHYTTPYANFKRTPSSWQFFLCITPQLLYNKVYKLTGL